MKVEKKRVEQNNGIWYVRTVLYLYLPTNLYFIGYKNNTWNDWGLNGNKRIIKQLLLGELYHNTKLCLPGIQY